MTDQDRLNILIVEDELLLAMELEFVLQDLGHTVVGTATCSQEALKLAEDHKPDLALVDIHLRDGPTGVAVADQISASSATKVIFMSANVSRIPCNYAGAVGHIGKPYSENGVKSAIAYVRHAIANPPPSVPQPASLVLAPEYERTWAVA